MSAAIIIPARQGSSRFPGKPKHPVAGVAVLERVWRIARSVPSCSRVVIATEDSSVQAFAQSFGAEAVMTSETCRNGTERMHEALAPAGIREEIVVNLQGDAVLTPPWIIEDMIAAMVTDPSLQVLTPAVVLTDHQRETLAKNKLTNEASGTTVVCDKDMRALYFSKRILPYVKKVAHAPTYRHIGLYAYRRDLLARYCAMPQTPLELTEELEQLRLLENGVPIKVLVVDYRGRSHASIDHPDDVAIAERIIADEGELVAGLG